MNTSEIAPNKDRPGPEVPAGSLFSASKRDSAWSEWVDRQSRTLFISPAVFLILVFSIFPLVASLLISFTRIRPRVGGYQIRWVGLKNFKKLFTGSEQSHLLGTMEGGISLLGWTSIIVVAALLLWWLYRYVRQEFKVVGFIGRIVTTAAALAFTILFATTLLSGRQFGTMPMTLVYVLFGCSLQFLIGLGLAYVCTQPIRGRAFFSTLFFIPITITPVGIAYQWRMLADMNKGPVAPLWEWMGLGEFAWGSLAWPARSMVMISDAWMWIPFIFVVMLAALETVSRDLTEAAEVDGAGKWLIFRDITLPQIAPVAGTILLIRWIEGFKLVDIPNILTNGGPGIATETLTMHSWTQWRTLDFAGSSAVAYTLLFVSVVICVSFFNLVIRRYSRRQ